MAVAVAKVQSDLEIGVPLAESLVRHGVSRATFYRHRGVEVDAPFAHLNERHRDILYHACRYGLTLNPAVDLLFFGRQHAPSRPAVMQALCRRGLLEAHPLRPSGLTYYAPSAALREKAEFQHGPLDEGAQVLALAVLGYCCLEGGKRVRLTRAETKAALSHGNAESVLPQAAVWVLNADSETPHVEEIVLLTASAGGAPPTVRAMVDRLEHRLEVANQLPQLQRHLRGGTYRFRGVVENALLAASLGSALRSASLDARVGVAVVPTPETIETYLRERPHSHQPKEAS